MAEDQAVPLEVFQIAETTRAPEHREIYASSARTRVSPWDVALVFSHHIEKTPGRADISLEEVVTVVMSPHHFKAFVGLVNNAMTGFEAAMGKIVLPDALMPKSPPPAPIKSESE